MAPQKKQTRFPTAPARSNDQISALESEIKKLDTQIQRTRRAQIPFHRHSARRNHPQPARKIPAERRPRDPRSPPRTSRFLRKSIPSPLAAARRPADPGHYNELGVRKYDLPALWNRLRNHLRGPTTKNPRLVNYLAAGGVHGLRPMRYEKRVARNRFIALVIVLFLILLGVISVFVKNH